MNVTVELECCCQDCWVPDHQLIDDWVNTAWAQLSGNKPRTSDDSINYSLCLRVVTDAEAAGMNSHYRGSPAATNVLSFPARLPEHVAGLLDPRPLGDIAICGTLVASEAAEQGKDIGSHWAHLLIHGVLHLAGYDHRTSQDAKRMEGMEIAAMQALGFADPYRQSALSD
ncbi:MAG: rRNA maturation RNase YbeY [Pseudohongiellaceae bacterium]